MCKSHETGTICSVGKTGYYGMLMLIFSPGDIIHGFICVFTAFAVSAITTALNVYVALMFNYFPSQLQEWLQDCKDISEVK